MVRADKEDAADFLNGFHSGTDTFIDLLNRLDGCLEDAGVADHVRVGEVDDNDIIFAAADGRVQFLADFGRAHFRLEVIGRYRGRRNQDPVLILVGIFNTAVEEEGYMGIFLGLCQTQLLEAVGCQILTEGIVDGDLLESNIFVGDGLIIILEADIGQRHIAVGSCQVLDALGVRSFAGLFGDIFIREAECLGDLSGTVRTEVEENDGVIGFYDGQGLAFFIGNDSGQNELVRHALVIGVLHSLDAVGRLVAYAQYQGVICLLDTVPVVIPVHRIVTAVEGSHLAYADLRCLVDQLLQIALAGRGRCISAVEERMQIYSVQALSLAELQDRVQVGVVAVYAAVGKQAPDVQIGIVLFTVIDGAEQFFVLEEYAVLDIFGDQCQVLIYDAAAAHVHMADLGVAHLAIRKTYEQSGGIALLERILFHQLIHYRGLCHIDRIGLLVLRQAITVQYHKYYGFSFH